PELVNGTGDGYVQAPPRDWGVRAGMLRYVRDDDVVELEALDLGDVGDVHPRFELEFSVDHQADVVDVLEVFEVAVRRLLVLADDGDRGVTLALEQLRQGVGQRYNGQTFVGEVRVDHIRTVADRARH